MGRRTHPLLERRPREVAREGGNGGTLVEIVRRVLGQGAPKLLPMIFQRPRVAKQAGGAVLLGMGETVILGVATMSENPREGIDFLPLTCVVRHANICIRPVFAADSDCGYPPAHRQGNQPDRDCCLQMKLSF